VSFLIVMVLLLVVMYVLMIRPQRAKQQQHQSMIDACGVGDDVLTTGGIYGTITQAEGDDLVVQIADGMNVHMTRRGVAAVLPPEDEEAPDAETETAVDGDQDEIAVTAEEEAVTAADDAETAAAERR
jgi:preprotein translocase subunit YajC